ncbi:heterokaryon incompatibility protein-domain-containing protein [Pestalotiopsis sp. NC0098]|nr:heterokaryon incompatibility protein-domain-containing protein [Pestalotiopsis sp. NC0098]
MSAVAPSDVDWHPESCQRFDYAQFYGTDLSTCRSCGSFGLPPASLPTTISLPPLPSKSAFRLLRLDPGKFEETVRCHVELSDLGPGPAFNAISYTWADESGDDRKLAEILLDGKPFKVTRNCDLALRRVRQRGYAAPVWIDAICIDQSNDMERGHQVKLMPQIYEQATKVLMYIGEHDNNSRELFERFEIFLIAVNKSEGSKKISHSDGEAIWKALKERNYFSRLWILQEIALARQAEVLCGESSLEWKHIIDHGLGKYRIQTSLKDSVLGFNRSNVALPDQELFVLDRGRHALCKDPRDKVYGLLGLLPHRRIGPIGADYSVSVQQLYTSLAVELAQLHGWFAVLSRAGSRYRNLNSLPSWVPDWTCVAGDYWNSDRITRPACIESNSVIVSNNTIRLNLLQSPAAADRWLLSNSLDQTAGIHLWHEEKELLNILRPYLKMARWWDHHESRGEFLEQRSSSMRRKPDACLILRSSQSPQSQDQDPGCQNKVLREILTKDVNNFPVEQNIFPPLETPELKQIIYDNSYSLRVGEWVRPERDMSRSNILGALRQAYSETHKDASREWTLQAESLWAEKYKEENGILETWRRKKRKELESGSSNHWPWSRPWKADEKERYLEAELKEQEVDFEMNDLFWRLVVRRCAVRAQLVDIV